LRTSADPPSEIDDMSTTRRGRALPASTPPLPNRTSFRSSVVETMVNTVSQCAIAVLSVTTSAPSLASGSAFDAVLFHTDRSWPPLIKRAAMASPMRPSPIQPMACDALLLDAVLLAAVLFDAWVLIGGGTSITVLRCCKRCSLGGVSVAVHVRDLLARGWVLRPSCHWPLAVV
jgi:hypothetical protein